MTAPDSVFSNPFQRFAAFLLLISFVVVARAGDEPQRPKILGISHVGFYVSNLQKARWFYEDFLGFAEPYNLRRNDVKEGLRMRFYCGDAGDNGKENGLVFDGTVHFDSEKQQCTQS